MKEEIDGRKQGERKGEDLPKKRWMPGGKEGGKKRKRGVVKESTKGMW